MAAAVAVAVAVAFAVAVAAAVAVAVAVAVVVVVVAAVVAAVVAVVAVVVVVAQCGAAGVQQNTVHTDNGGIADQNFDGRTDEQGCIHFNWGSLDRFPTLL